MTGSLSMIFVDMTVVGIALPSIGGSLNMNAEGQAWIVTSYLLTMASLLALGGRLGDLLGRVPAFIAGVVGFAAASAICGLAQDGTMLIAGRVAQGISACLMQPASGALVVSSFAQGERGKAMAVYVGIPLLFMALGPALGGVVVQQFGWRWVFYLNLPVAAMAVLLTAVARPHQVRSQDRRIDWAGGGLLLLGLPPLVFGIQELGAAAGGTRSAEGVEATSVPVAAAVGCIVWGVVALAVFARHQWNSARPLLKLHLFASRPILGSAVIIACMQFGMTGFVIQGSIYAREVLGYSPAKAGASLLPLLAPVILMVHVAGRWYDRAGVRKPVITGTALATVGQLVQALGAWMQNYPVMALGMLVMGTGIAFTLSPSNTDALSRAPSEDRGQVSGLVQTLRQVGASVGLAAVAAGVLLVQSMQEARVPELTHAQVEALRHGFRADDPQAVERANTQPEAAQVRAIVATSMAAGSLVAAAAFAAACLTAVRLLPTGQPLPRGSAQPPRNA